MLITANQIRAARALKNWSQSELAERINMATPSIGNIEAGKHNATPQTQNAIIEAFNKAGIEFIDGGVRERQDLIRIYEGSDCYLQLLDDVFYSLKDDRDAELLISCSDDKVSPPAVNDSYRRIRKAGIKMRQLVEDCNTYLMGDIEEYRYLPKPYFINRVLVIYGQKVAIVLDNETKIIVVNDEVMAYVQRNIFNLLFHSLENLKEVRQMNSFNHAFYEHQIREYSVKVKNGAGWRDFNTCRLQISVGQEYHEGAKLEATVRWAEQHFEKIIICVNDTLQRYNSILPGMSQSFANRKWDHEGNEWIRRNQHLFKQSSKIQIHKWDFWKKLPEFEKAQAATEIFFATNHFFRSAINENTRTFWLRNQEKIKANYSDFCKLSQSYLLEETAVFSIMFEKCNAVDIYPGSVLLPAILFRNNPVHGMPQGLDKGAFTRIDFRRNFIIAENINQNFYQLAA